MTKGKARTKKRYVAYRKHEKLRRLEIEAPDKLGAEESAVLGGTGVKKDETIYDRERTEYIEEVK